MGLFADATKVASPYMLAIKLAAVGIVLAIVLGLWWRGNHYENKYDSEHAEYEGFKSTQTALAAAQLEDQKRKDKEADTAETRRKTEYLIEINKYKIDADMLKKESGHDKIYIANLISKLNRVRNDSSAGASTAAEIQVPAELLTESGGDCDATLARTVNRCQDTTINYNSLYNAWLDNCAIYGCQK